MEPSSQSVDTQLPYQGVLDLRECSTRNLPLVEFLACVIEGRQALYVSTPITTGPRYLQWLRQKGRSQNDGQATLRREVIEPNLAHGRELVCRVRGRFKDVVVIDPTAVRLPGWGQEEYRELWGHVIERYTRLVIFGDGWEYSHGCVYEFSIAHLRQVEVLDERYLSITVNEGLLRIRKAIAGYQALGLSIDLLTSAVEKMTQLSSLEGKQ